MRMGGSAEPAFGSSALPARSRGDSIPERKPEPVNVGFASCLTLAPRLHARFCKFQGQARRIQEQVEATQKPVDSGLAEDVLQQYSFGIAHELRNARDELRRGKWDIDPSIRNDHDSLCMCLAVLELVHELGLTSAPSAPRLIHWYNRHYLEEDIAEWWQQASQYAEDADVMNPNSPFWEPLVRLALSDCHAEVLQLVRRLITKDVQVHRVSDFLRKTQSLLQMEQNRSRRVEFQQDVAEVQNLAKRLIADMPEKHPMRKLLRVYAGCSQTEFDRNEDVGAEMGRSWVEDVAYVHAWVFPDLRKTELGDLLRSVALRRKTETIDCMDQIFFAIFTMDIPALLKEVGSLADKFPSIFVAHLVDTLYFAGRVPLVVESKGKQLVPPRDWHLIQYSQGLASGSRDRKRLAVDYLRSGGSDEAIRELEIVAEDYCKTAKSETDMDDAVALLADLGLGSDMGPAQCRRHSSKLRDAGDIAGCLRWACQAEQHADVPRGYHVSELLDSLASNPQELQALLETLSPESLDEPLGKYPPESLTTLLSPSGAQLELAPSGRLYFFVQYTRCLAMKNAGRPAKDWAPCLVGLLTAGVAGPPNVARVILEEDLLPALTDDEPILNTEQVLLLMRYAQNLQTDPFQRTQLSVPAADLHRTLGLCFSRSVLCKSSDAAPSACGTGSKSWSGPALMQGLTA